jgi:hypothetical protein
MQVPVGRDSDACTRILSARCTYCTAGDQHPACNHVLTALVCLHKLQIGLITAGDVGDGERAWGSFTSSSSVPVQSIAKISVLTGGSDLVSFRGLRPETPPFTSVMLEYINLYQQRAPSKPTMVEINRGLGNYKQKAQTISTIKPVKINVGSLYSQTSYMRTQVKTKTVLRE